MDDRYTDDDFYNYPFPSFTDNRNKFARASLILGMCSMFLYAPFFSPFHWAHWDFSFIFCPKGFISRWIPPQRQGL